MKYLNPQLPLEKQLQAQIYNALQGDVVNFVQKYCEDNMEDILYKSMMEGSSMKIDEVVMGDLYKLCIDVKNRLGFEEPVDFYITGSSEINAWAHAAKEPGKPHFVNIYSALHKMLDEDELRCVIGHELGHLMNRDTELARLVSFVYPGGFDTMPVALRFKFGLELQLRELVADRYGYLACGNLNACVTSDFKLSSGLDLLSMGVKVEDLLAKNEKSLDFFINGGGISQGSHPVQPIRTQAIKLFATCQSEEELEKAMEPLLQIILKSGANPMDPPMSIFLASAGIITARIDGEVKKEEYENIVANLSASHIFPSKFMEWIMEQDVDQLFIKSVNDLIEQSPTIRPGLLQYMIEMIIADREIQEKEVNFIYHIGQQLGMSVKEISQLFAAIIQRYYTPSLSSLD